MFLRFWRWITGWLRSEPELVEIEPGGWVAGSDLATVMSDLHEVLTPLALENRGNAPPAVKDPEVKRRERAKRRRRISRASRRGNRG